MIPTTIKEAHVDPAAPAAAGAQKTGVQAFGHQQAVDRRQPQQGHAGCDGHQQQRRVVQAQDRAEQHVQQIHIGAAQRHQQHTQPQ
ncbi:hypothetical protein G6F59_017341 [Rhizopus arrhizus]|nr:hypothetical protein G6F59_017341 [Rhizopus arrhizus]